MSGLGGHSGLAFPLPYQPGLWASTLTCQEHQTSGSNIRKDRDAEWGFLLTTKPTIYQTLLCDYSCAKRFLDNISFHLHNLTRRLDVMDEESETSKTSGNLLKVTQLVRGQTQLV